MHTIDEDAPTAGADTNESRKTPDELDADKIEFLGFVDNGNFRAMKTALTYLSPVDAKVLANAVNRKGFSALILSIRHEYPNCTKLLLEHGADPNFTCCIGKDPKATPLRLAIKTNRPYIVKPVAEFYLRKNYMDKGMFLSARELESLFDSPLEAQMARRTLVDIYANMDISSMVEGVVADFRMGPALLLRDLLELAAAAQRKAMRLRSREPLAADHLSAASARLQLVAAGCLRAIGTLKDELGRYEVDELLRSPIGYDALKTATRYNLRTFVAQPECQGFLRREWRGPLLDKVIEGGYGLPLQLFHLLFFCSALVGCLILLPLGALCPFLETYTYENLAWSHLDRMIRAQALRRAGWRRRAG